jgi:hypothetical protein
MAFYKTLCRRVSSLFLIIKKQTIKACTFSWIKLPNILMAQEKGVFHLFTARSRCFLAW